jgi:hypothetical protein
MFELTKRVAKLVGILGLGAIATLVACSEDAGQPCYPGDLRACSCADGASGLQACATPDSGTRDYGECQCHVPDAAVDAATDGTGDAADGGLLSFMSPCTDNAQCATGLCFPFNAKGPHCSQHCMVTTDCPPPSPGCSNMNVCKAP